MIIGIKGRQIWLDSFSHGSFGYHAGHEKADAVWGCDQPDREVQCDDDSEMHGVDTVTVAIGIRIGIKIRIAETLSMNIPTIRSRMFTTSRYMTAEPEMPRRKPPSILGTP